MFETIKNILINADIDDWTVLEKRSRSRELFFIRKSLDMNRAKDVVSSTVTVFKDFTEDCTSYRGSASVVLGNNMTEEEMKAKLENAVFAAGFVKNPHYPIHPGVTSSFTGNRGRLSEKNLMPVCSDIIKSLYKHDNHQDGGINSAELFLNQMEYRFVSSEGTDLSYTQNRGTIELVCDWNDGKGGVELYNMFSFADFDSALIEEECRRQIESCRLRAEARPAGLIESVNIILKGAAVRDMMDFYRAHSNVKGIYEGTARGKKGEVFQGDGVRGDLVTISLDPFLSHSPYSAPVDRDGVKLKKICLYDRGKLLRYHGSQQYSSYLEEQPSGEIPNIIVDSGQQSVEEWKKEPHVEIVTFSDFQMDSLTGDFGGEIRLALYYDGEKTVPLTGASLSSCLFDVQKEMYLSKERVDIENYSGPGYLMFPGGTISGA
ncbi:MAG: metallopeptidase TldD-related protein [Spirochaetales bacterium]|nr:metallopeptidase TldD-related protein [Spirochaetales bacterium]